ncbi:MAG: NAD(P)/FAD-dependent oxidoreductase [Ferruginibacter sp.]
MKKKLNKSSKKEIVIIGGGFAGTNFAQRLLKNSDYHITLVDRNNYNFFPPLIYQVATGFLEISSISYPFRKLFRHKKNINFRMGEFLKLDPISHTCYLNNGAINYDFLVFATGVETNYFGNENIRKYAIPMKTVNDASRMRNILLQSLENASRTNDEIERKKLLTIVVAGGGPTGVEVSGMLAELRKYILAKDYPELINTPGNIFLVDGGKSLLAQMSEKSHQEAYDSLIKLGVKIKLETIVKNFDGDQIALSNGQVINSKNLIWAAGIIGEKFEGIPQKSIGRGNRMIVDSYNQVEGINDVYAIGDISIQYTDLNFSKGHPQLAQVAIQHGKALAENFKAMSLHKKLKPFKYKDKGSLAIIGRYRAVADLFPSKFHVGGFLALMIWLFVHLTSLITYRNRLKTLSEWIIAYFTMDQSLRMIIRPDTQSDKGNANLEATKYQTNNINI